MKGLEDIMKQAQKMQENLQKAQEELANKEVTGESGAGLVKVLMTGRHDVKKVFSDGSVFKEDKEILEDLLAAARALGLETRFKTRVTGIVQQSGRVAGVNIAGAGGADHISAPVVVNCAGPWAMGLSEAAGAPLPQRIQPTRIQKVGKSLSDPMRAPLPVLNDLVTGLHIRPEPGNEQIFLGSFRAEHHGEPVADPDHFNEVADAPFCGDDGRPEVRQVIDIIAGGTTARILDHTILLLRDALKLCIRRGDSSLFAAESAEEEDMDCVVR